MKTLLKGGRVVSGSGWIEADVLLEGDKISRVEADITDRDARVVDVSGRFVFPGFIDAHTHFDLAVAGTVTADDFETGTRAAVSGGTTTIVDFATQYRGETLKEALDNWHKRRIKKAPATTVFTWPFPNFRNPSAESWKKSSVTESLLLSCT